MKGSGDQLERLTNILKQAYLGKERIEVGDQWQNSVMVRIRAMSPIASASGFLPTFEQLFWRLAPATSLLTLALAALSIAIDFVFEYDLFQLLLSAAEDSALVHLFGM
jgi:hypothetical protein